ncbi:hypothetical protein, partial [uncultured Marinobacter sp.]|uniref:hypothetical protein n=1 Tax=uncultured Marinobacter sp. TaxID=187379 RepID=UPI0025917438
MVLSELHETLAGQHRDGMEAEWLRLPASHRCAVEEEVNRPPEFAEEFGSMHGRDAWISTPRAPPEGDESSPSCFRMDGEDSDQEDEELLACRKAELELHESHSCDLASFASRPRN